MFRVEEHLWHKNQGKHDAQAMGVPYKDGIRYIMLLTSSLDIKAEWVIWGKEPQGWHPFASFPRQTTSFLPCSDSTLWSTSSILSQPMLLPCHPLYSFCSSIRHAPTNTSRNPQPEAPSPFSPRCISLSTAWLD